MKIELIEHKGNFNGFTPFDIKCENGWLTGTFQHEENRICISHAMCRSCMKELIIELIKKYKTNKIMFYNLLNTNLIDKVKGFRLGRMIDPVFKEPVLYLEGEWDYAVPEM